MRALSRSSIPMRIAIVGTSGSGKTTLARALAAQLALPYVELDAVNWQAGWRDLSRNDPDEFVRRVTLAVAADAWVVDGNYGLVRDFVWRRATHLVWLDYERRIVMYRVHPPHTSQGCATHGNVGRQPRAVAAHVAAEPSNPLGLEHLASAPPRVRRAHRAGRLCPPRRSAPAPAARREKAAPPA